MPFERKLDSSFPCVYDTWKSGDSTFVIQDLPPEGEEEALKVLSDLISDETLCNELKLIEDPVGLKSARDCWQKCFAQRMTLACYEEKNGVRTLAGANVCIVVGKEDDQVFEYKGKWKHVYDAVLYAENKRDCFEYLGTDPVLLALGLVVKKEYRGKRLGERILNAREPLALPHDITASATVFTSPGGQKTAINCGYVTISETTFKELADAGIPFPSDERILKYMVKKFKK